MNIVYERHIKFRAWHKVKCQIFAVHLIDFITHTAMLVPMKGGAQSLVFEASFDDLELLQYTNLDDMNGTKIYEGHIVQDPETKRVYEVLFRADRYMVERRKISRSNPGYELSDLYPLNEKVKVVGNIFEHPKLLSQVGYTAPYEDFDKSALENVVSTDVYHDESDDPDWLTPKLLKKNKKSPQKN